MGAREDDAVTCPAGSSGEGAGLTEAGPERGHTGRACWGGQAGQALPSIQPH